MLPRKGHTLIQHQVRAVQSFVQVSTASQTNVDAGLYRPKLNSKQFAFRCTASAMGIRCSGTNQCTALPYSQSRTHIAFFRVHPSEIHTHALSVCSSSWGEWYCQSAAEPATCKFFLIGNSICFCPPHCSLVLLHLLIVLWCSYVHTALVLSSSCHAAAARCPAQHSGSPLARFALLFVLWTVSDFHLSTKGQSS